MKKLWAVTIMSMGLHATSADYLCISKETKESMSMEFNDFGQKVKVLLYKHKKSGKKVLKGTLIGKQINGKGYFKSYKLINKNYHSASLKISQEAINKFPVHDYDDCKQTAMGCVDLNYPKKIDSAQLYSATDTKYFKCHLK